MSYCSMHTLRSEVLLVTSWIVLLRVQGARALVTEDIGFVDRNTEYGTVRGMVRMVHGVRGVERYLGVPYAQPPVGDLRYESPVPPHSWKDTIRLTISLPPACPQATEGISYIEYHVPGFNRSSEDCLYLNIYVPQRSGRRKKALPVVLFIHGGSYQSGMGAMFDGTMLAVEGVVVVTVNYRLGPLGFLSAGDRHLPGNYGMLDQVAALKWIRSNIHHFDGDPERVTIDGHSAGGCCVGLHQLSPLSKGLFKRVIQQSGSPLANWAVNRYRHSPDFFFKLFVSSVGCMGNSTAEIKACLKALPSEKLESVILDEFEWTPSLVPQYQPCVDGYFLTDTPENLVLRGEMNANEFMTGATRDEGVIAAVPLVNFFNVEGSKTSPRRIRTLLNSFRCDLPDVRGIVGAILDEYETWPYSGDEEYVKTTFSQIVGDYYITAPTHLYAQALSSRGVNVYVYNFEYQSAYALWDGVIHGAEIFYLSGFPIIGHDYFTYDRDDVTMAQLIITMWANFIKSGVPSLAPDDNLVLLPYSPQNTVYARFSKSPGHPAITMESRLKARRISFWNKRVPEMYAEQLGNVMYISTGDVDHVTYDVGEQESPTWILGTICLVLILLLLMIAVSYFRLRKQMKTLLRWKATEIIS